MENKQIADFYDSFSERQYKVGANERLLTLYKRLRKLGLKSGSTVLELGCGVGIFTNLICKTVRKGRIEAVDLSPQSIELAKKHIRKRQVSFHTGDVVVYQPKHHDFDFITLMDVLEHIPLEKHLGLFQNLVRVCSEKTKIVINIPDPRLIEYYRQTAPEKLQVIDQSVELEVLAQNIEKAGLEILFFEKYSIWDVYDYNFLVIRKKRPFELVHLSDIRNLQEKVVHKVSMVSDHIRL